MNSSIIYNQGYAFDFHIHTKYSNDSYTQPEKLLKSAIKNNLDGIAITDHNTIEGALKAKLYQTEEIIVIVGSEIMTDVGEIIGLFLNEEIKCHDYGDVCDEIKEQDGIILLPHPYRNQNPELMIHRVDLIECLNARSSKEANINAKKLATKHDIPCVSGSDAHILSEIGNVRTVYSSDKMDLDIESIKKTLLNDKAQIIGCESSKMVKTLSRGIGKYKKEGIKGLAKSTSKIVLRNK
ncbi:PHP domain-containing protein [Methanolobus sp. ZRKC2]|uniref:PHP domain-containing protein n=1 Tax=Methanolobus sp. ZRKC2 TaxID=3125783 RepID=UPI003253278E